MAVIDLTLNRLKLPGLANYTPPFGTKKAEDVALTTLEGCNNFTLPYELERPVVVSENSSCTGLVEHNALIDIDTANVTLTLANGAFRGVKAEIMCSASNGSGSIICVNCTYPIEYGQRRVLEWDGSGWWNVNTAEIGAVSGYLGANDPVSKDWLILDGRDTTGTAIELESVYPRLYKFLGNSNVLPDLRGEFLRGAGTNSHSGEGNGGTVGQHQSATSIANMFARNTAFNVRERNTEEYTTPENMDAGINGTAYEVSFVTSTIISAQNNPVRFTTRPTNTSVNWIICAR